MNCFRSLALNLNCRFLTIKIISFRDTFCRDYSADLEEEFIAYKKVVLSGQDSGFGSLMTRLEAALSVNAYENESVLKKCSNSSVKRKESKIRRAKRREEEGPGADFLLNRDGVPTESSHKELKLDIAENDSI